MKGVSLWYMDGGTSPKRLKRGQLDLEKELEDWIEADPSLVQPGMEIVGRQFKIDPSCIIDLLALSPDGNWVIIEIKRDKPRRSALGQLVNYVASFNQMPFSDIEKQADRYLLQQAGMTCGKVLKKFGIEDDVPGQRQVDMVLVGTSLDLQLQGMVDYLQRQNVPVSVVTIDVFEIESGRRIVVREMPEQQDRSDLPHAKKHSITEMRDLASQYGVGEEFRLLLEAKKNWGFAFQVHGTSMSFTPAQNRTRTLFSVRLRPYKCMKVFISPQTFAEFYPASEEEVREHLGDEGWQDMNLSTIKSFTEGLYILFEHMRQRE